MIAAAVRDKTPSDAFRQRRCAQVKFSGKYRSCKSCSVNTIRNRVATAAWVDGRNHHLGLAENPFFAEGKSRVRANSTIGRVPKEASRSAVHNRRKCDYPVQQISRICSSRYASTRQSLIGCIDRYPQVPRATSRELPHGSPSRFWPAITRAQTTQFRIDHEKPSFIYRAHLLPEQSECQVRTGAG